MPTAPKVVLQNVVRISDTSVFLVPKDGDTLDFGTVNSAPPAHRAVLQKNGLVAKVCIGINAITGGGEAEADLLSPEGRARLWRDALVQLRLISVDTVAIAVPPAFDQDPWPLLSKDEYDARMQVLAARHANEEANTSSFCVPAIAVQQLVYRSSGVHAAVGIVWMPRYAQSLTEWAESRIRTSSKPLPESCLTTMLQHVTVGLAALGRTVTSKAQRSTEADRHCDHPTGLDTDSILVHETDGQPVFSLALSQLALSRKQRGLVSNLAQTRFKQLNLLPYLAPEQVQSQETPIMRSPRFAVWALGAIALVLGSGTPSIASQLQCQNRRRAELPLNHPSVTPDAVINRVRRDLTPGGYSGGFMGLVGLLLAQDHLTRPTLRTVDRMLQDLNRTIPVHRFPFVIGDLSMLRVPQPACVQLNPSARKYVTSDACCVCRKPRNRSHCKGREHTPAMTSPCWGSDEPLPGFLAEGGGGDGRMAYLYPLIPTGLDQKERRKLLSLAVSGPRSSQGSGGEGVSPKCARAVNSSSVMPVGASPVGAGLAMNASVGSTALSTGNTMVAQDTPSLNPSLLFQLFGGFAVFERHSVAAVQGGKKDRAVATDVLVPFPAKALRRCEGHWAVVDLNFTAALPWPSACTRALQKKGRVCGEVPALLGGLMSASANGSSECVTACDVVPKFFAWIAPNERFLLENGHQWTPAPEGGFVLWFNENLEPSDMDRYFAVTSLRTCTASARVPQTVLTDHVFRKHVGDSSRHASVMHFGLGRSVSHQDLSRHHTPHGASVNITGSAFARRRSLLSVAAIEVPAGKAVYEEEPDLDPQNRSQTKPHTSTPTSAREGLTSSNRRRTPSHDNRRASLSAAAQSATCRPAALTSDEDRAEAVVRRSFQRPDGNDNANGSQRRNSETNALGATVNVDAGTAATATTSGTTTREASSKTDGSGTTSPSTPDSLESQLSANAITLNETHKRKSRRHISPSQRKKRLSAPKMTAIGEVVCTSPIVEVATRRRRKPSPPLNATATATTTATREAALTRLPSKRTEVPSRLAALSVNRQPDARSAANSKAAAEANQGITTPAEPTPAGATAAALLPIVTRKRSENGAAATPRAGPQEPPRRPSDSTPVHVPQISLTPLQAGKGPIFAGTPAADAPHTPGAIVALFGKWLPPDVVDAPFDSLTFYVPATEEHGTLQSPVAVTETARTTLHCPAAAAFMSFLSNEAPLIGRNHQIARDQRIMHFPHHGFVFYASDGAAVGALALRCGPAGSMDMEPEEEFPIIGNPLPPRKCVSSFGLRVNASYFSLADTPHNGDTLLSPEASPGPVPHLRHSTQATAKPPVTPQDHQLLTFSSARRLVGDLTITDSPATGDFSQDAGERPSRGPSRLLLDANPDMLLPVCWMGFDWESGALVMADVGKGVWHPIAVS